MRRRIATILPALLASVWLLGFFAPVLSPGRALANRDVPTFHLPLRTAFRELAAFGLPVWNPWLHGGEPVLSNPSYAAFYPPSWLVLAVPPAYALSLLAVLHAAIAFAGAAFLARRLGCGRETALLAGLGFAGCGVYVSFLSAFNLYWGITWLPWVLAWGDEALSAPAGEAWWRPGLLCGGALGLALLNGEPATAMMIGLGLLALAVPAAIRRSASAARIALPFLVGAALAAVQILPTLGRLAESRRRGLGFAEATQWSMSPARLIEVVFPRFFGDLTRDLEGLYLGWTISDAHYPYVESLYPGLLLAVLGLAALVRGGIPRRWAWALACAGGWFLALGRRNPAYAWLRRAFPPLAVLRYPEKFAVLAVLALAVAGVLGWQRLLDERRAGRPEAASLPLALALAVLAAAASLALLLRLAPGAGLRFVAANSDPHLGDAGRAAALGYLRGESWIALATAAAVAVLLALCRSRRPPERLLQGLALVLLAADLWHAEHGLLRSVPAAVYSDPPPFAAALQPAANRMFMQPVLKDSLDLTPVEGDLRTLTQRREVASLQPYSGLLWGIPSVFEVDFELMLTRWGQRADEIMRTEWSRPGRGYRFLGVWNVENIFLRRTLPEQEAMLRDPAVQGNPAEVVLRRVANPFVLPRFRFVPRVSFHSTHAAALAAARALAWKVARDEQCVGEPARTLTYTRPPQPLKLVDEGGRIRIDYAAEEGAFLVAAMTFDEGWQARLDGASLPVYPTAACQLGVAVPAGRHRLVLEFREPLVRVGAAVTLAALAAGAAALGWPRRPPANRRDPS
ncbi:MAG TPA: hypothetical protein VF173_17990 [Thermoanaerobaculia bacterium]|nr:hypothetical protein [Thermoanaerobaculia bacterium]